jgi:hypothetical protein
MKKMIAVWKPKKDGSMKLKWKRKKVKPVSWLTEETPKTENL